MLVPAMSHPRSPKARRAALFSELTTLFGWDLAQFNQQSRGMLNKAAMQLHESGIHPEQLPRLKQAFERA